MTSVENLSPDPNARKQLGQYFTGPKLASLLAHLAAAHEAKSVLDPMAGRGDMLFAADAVGGGDGFLQGVEIDPAALDLADRAPSARRITLRVGDAFSPTTWASLPAAWDLVITNPPYVRYQRLRGQSAAGAVATPSALSIRTGLTEILTARSDLAEHERACFVALASSYSGLADLAVPSWILAASFVRVGGRLALVAPATWMSRNYAGPALYLLSRFFEIEAVVEDGDASWFPDALVRTTLVIARRVEDRCSADDGLQQPHVRARLHRQLAGPSSVVERLYPANADADAAFACDVKRVLNGQEAEISKSCELALSDGDELATLLDRHRSARWYQESEAMATPRQRVKNQSRRAAPSRTLGDYGWQVGQGLRSGANAFFYADLVEEQGDDVVMAMAPDAWPEPLKVPTDLVLPVIRRQQECRGKNEVQSTSGRVLLLNSVALAEDLEHLVGIGAQATLREMPEPLASYVRQSAVRNVGSLESPSRIPDLSAVATNIRQFDPRRPERVPRFWYQLPPLAERHRPSLFVPRVNNGAARVIANPGRSAVVDANFSTLWPGSDASISPDTLLALINSTAFALGVERTATVLGGGALKVEATLLRRLPLPELDERAIEDLEPLGRVFRRSPSDDVLSEIDDVVFAALGQDLRSARETLQALVRRRSPRHSRSR